MDTVAPSGCKTWVDICFAHLCDQGLVDFVFLIRWCRVSREWMDALKRAVRLMQQVFLPGGVTGEEALRALGLVAGGNINIVDLRGCSLISAEHMASIVALVREECPGAMEINIEGCSDWAVVRAVAECVAETFGISTSRELYQRIKEMGNGERCAFPRLLEHLQEGPGPRLALDPEFKPEAEPQSDEDSDGEDFSSRILARFTDGGETGPVCAKVMALLLGVSFDDDEFQCSTSQLRDAAARGDTELVSLLLDAGVDINEANEQGDTALMLACRAGLLELATRLKDAGANVSVANEQGETPLLFAVAIGNLVLAELLVSWGADVKAQRRDGAGLIALAIHSKCPDSISFALRHGPKRIASQSTFDALAQAYVSPRNIQQWLLAGASPRTLALEIGALLLHPKVDAGRLDDMRALLHRHKELLQDTAKWPVPHVVEQLAAQDLGASVQQEATDGSGEGMCRLIECITPSSATGEYGRLVNAQACRWSIEGDNAVYSVAFSPDMLKLARGEGNDAIVCCAVSGLELRRLVGHRNWVWSVACRFDGKVLASGGRDNKIILWDPEKGERLKTLEGHSDWVRSVAWRFDGRLLASGGADNNIILWDPEKGERLKTLEGHSSAVNGVSFSADGSLVASCSGDYRGDFSVRMWSVETGQELKKFLGYSGRVYGIDWSIDGLLASCSGDGTVKIWNPSSSGECLKTLKGHRSTVSACVFAPHGKTIVSASWDATLKIWDVELGTCLTTLEGHSGGVYCVSFNPSNPTLLVSGSGGDNKTIRLWDVGTGKELKKLEGHSSRVNGVSISADGSLVASCSGSPFETGGGDCSVRMWSVETGHELKKFLGHRYAVKKVEFSQDGATLVSSNDNETISWDVATGARKDKVAGQLAFTKTEIGRYIVTHQDDLIFVYDTRGVVVNADGKEKVPIAFFRAPSPVVSVCCAGDKVAVGCQSGAVLTLHAAWLTDGGAA